MWGIAAITPCGGVSVVLGGSASSRGVIVGVTSGPSGIGGAGIALVVAVAIIASVIVASGMVIGVAVVAIAETIVGVIETQAPVGTVKPSEKEGVVPPVGIIKGVVETPVEVEISPRVVVDIINFGTGGLGSPWRLVVCLSCGVRIYRSPGRIVFGIGKGVSFGVVQNGIIIGHIVKIFLITTGGGGGCNPIVFCFHPGTSAIDSIGIVVGSSLVGATRKQGQHKSGTDQKSERRGEAMCSHG